MVSSPKRLVLFAELTLKRTLLSCSSTGRCWGLRLLSRPVWQRAASTPRPQSHQCGHLYCTYVAVLITPCRENKALVNTKAEILYTFCRCIVFFWLFTFYDAQQQKLYCFNNVQCTFMDLNSSSDFRLK